MRSITRYASITAAAAFLSAVPPACWAQKWEVGAVGGGSVYMSASVTGPAGSGDVGIKPGPVLGAFVGNSMAKYFGGELRYEYIPGDLKVSSNGAESTFSGHSQAIHYDFLAHFTPADSRIRPFVSAGGGVKIYQGTSKATVTQPLSGLALLTNTYETKGLGSFGGGVKAAVTRRVMLRFEAHDFITPFPRQVIAPAPGAKVSGLLNEIVFMAGIGITF